MQQCWRESSARSRERAAALVVASSKLAFGLSGSCSRHPNLRTRGTSGGAAFGPAGTRESPAAASWVETVTASQPSQQSLGTEHSTTGPAPPMWRSAGLAVAGCCPSDLRHKPVCCISRSKQVSSGSAMTWWLCHCVTSCHKLDPETGLPMTAFPYGQGLRCELNYWLAMAVTQKRHKKPPWTCL